MYFLLLFSFYVNDAMLSLLEAHSTSGLHQSMFFVVIKHQSLLFYDFQRNLSWIKSLFLQDFLAHSPWYDSPQDWTRKACSKTSADFWRYAISLRQVQEDGCPISPQGSPSKARSQGKIAFELSDDLTLNDEICFLTYVEFYENIRFLTDKLNEFKLILK